jgi:hypothetical protein
VSQITPERTTFRADALHRLKKLSVQKEGVVDGNVVGSQVTQLGDYLLSEDLDDIFIKCIISPAFLILLLVKYFIFIRSAVTKYSPHRVSGCWLVISVRIILLIARSVDIRSCLCNTFNEEAQ